MTAAGTMLGTPAYMSPEQLMAQTVDPRSDLYSSGVMLYQLLTGERPFEGGLTAIIHKALNTTPPRPSELSVTAPPNLDAVVARAMARRPADRYPNAAAFSTALRQAYDAPEPGFTGLDAGSDDEATLFVQPSRPAAPPPPAASAAPAAGLRTVSPPPAKKGGGLNPALLGGVAVVVLGLAGGGAWFALRPSAPEPSVTQPPASPPLVVPPIPPASTPRVETPLPSPPAENQPPVPPPAPIPVPFDAAAARTALAALALSAPCALPRFGVAEDGAVNVSGMVGAGDPDAALRDAVRAAAPGASLAWGARQVDGPYCDVFNIVRPIAQPSGPFLNLALKDDLTRLKAHDSVLPVVRLPEFPSYLLVDYFSHDGSVAHLYPVRGVPNPPFGGNAVVRLGTTTKDRVEVGPPFGTDVIVAIASSVPLFPPAAAREDETMDTYLPALRGAIDAAQRRNAKVTGRALVLDTVER
jgi:serine/threonine-protein kinase